MIVQLAAEYIGPIGRERSPIPCYKLRVPILGRTDRISATVVMEWWQTWWQSWGGGVEVGDSSVTIGEGI